MTEQEDIHIGGIFKYDLFLVPRKCLFSQLWEDRSSKPKGSIKQQNKQWVWWQESGQGASFITVIWQVSFGAGTPPLRYRLWGGQRTSAGPPLLHISAFLGCQGTKSDISSVRITTRDSGTTTQLLFLAVYRIKDSRRERSESFPPWGTSGYCSCSVVLARNKVMFPRFSCN